MSNEIVMVLSGGAGNSDARHSLGGDPSGFPVPLPPKNNLFGNITEEQALSGYVDHRCVYFFNHSTTTTLAEAKLFVYQEVEGGADIALGFIARNDIQRILISGEPSGGKFDLEYTDEEGIHVVQVPFDPDVNAWAATFSLALNSETPLRGASVAGIKGPHSTMFTVSMTEQDGLRYHQIMKVGSNSLGGNPTITVSKVSDGSPINALAPLLSSELAIPPGVVFYTPTINEPLAIGTLRPGDGLPVWIKRVVGRQTDAVLGDGFTLRLSGKLFN